MFKSLVLLAALGVIQFYNAAEAFETDNLINTLRQRLANAENDTHVIKKDEEDLQPSDAEKEPCLTVDDLFGVTGDIIVNTTQIITGTVHEFYLLLYSRAECGNINTFRCFLWKFAHFGTNFVEVAEKVARYKHNLLKAMSMFKRYSRHCKNDTNLLLQ